MVDEQKLRQLAEAATPGPWITEDWASTDSDGAINVCGTSVMAPQALCGIFTVALEGDGTEDVDYIAAANPAAILSLLDELQTLREEQTAWKKQCDTLTHQVICCGVAASHPDSTLTTRGAYAGKWNSAQAEEVRKLRAECDQMREESCVPAGLKLVPIAPTDEMRDAGNAHTLNRGVLFAAWSAMLAASPQPQPHKPLFAEMISQHEGLREELLDMDQPQPVQPSEADITSAREHLADVHNAEQLRSALSQLRRDVVIELAARGLVPSIYGAQAKPEQAAQPMSIEEIDAALQAHKRIDLGNIDPARGVFILGVVAAERHHGIAAPQPKD